MEAKTTCSDSIRESTFLWSVLSQKYSFIDQPRLLSTHVGPSVIKYVFSDGLEPSALPQSVRPRLKTFLPVTLYCKFLQFTPRVFESLKTTVQYYFISCQVPMQVIMLLRWVPMLLRWVSMLLRRVSLPVQVKSSN